MSSEIMNNEGDLSSKLRVIKNRVKFFVIFCQINELINMKTTTLFFFLLTSHRPILCLLQCKNDLSPKLTYQSNPQIFLKILSFI